MDQKHDIAAIGDQDTIILFNAIGVKTFHAHSATEVERAIYQLATNNCKIIYVTEKLYQSIPETIEKYSYSPFPIILPIPNGIERLGIGKQRIRENVEKAIGIDIF